MKEEDRLKIKAIAVFFIFYPFVIIGHISALFCEHFLIGYYKTQYELDKIYGKAFNIKKETKNS